uniref:Metalloendopeptidase n=1 Tax=Parastrongyloides trichosuri TaxID=131310 RepID=A0A0N4Z5Q0_PARTI
MHIFVFLLVLLSFVSNIYSSIAIKSFSEFDHLRSKRSIDTDDRNKWDTTIYYYIEYRSWEDVIQRSLDDISANTCFDFKKKGQKITNTYGIIFKDGNECKYDFNHRNPVSNKPNEIYVGGCSDPYGAIRKLILNVLGLRGEHKRYDRDHYVNTYNYTHMTDQGRVEFQYDDNKTAETYNFGYDFSSITHAGVNEYKKGGYASSFDAKEYEKFYKDMMGQRIRPSFNDYKTVNKRYCENTCKDKPISCQFDGYQDPRNCDKCKCPSGFEGRECEKLARSSGDCGNAFLKATYQTQTLNVRGSKSCWYRIDADSGKRVVIKPRLIKVMERQTPCLEEHEGVQIKYRSDRGPAGLCICQNNEYGNSVDYNIRSESNRVYVHFKGTHYDSWVNLDYIQE